MSPLALAVPGPYVGICRNSSTQTHCIAPSSLHDYSAFVKHSTAAANLGLLYLHYSHYLLFLLAVVMVQLSSPWPHEGQQQQQQQQIESAIRHKLESSGEIDRIHHSLHANLTECGWRNVIQDAAKEAIRRKGLQPITLDQLVAALTPVARATVPAEVKVKMVEHLKSQCFRGD